MENWEKEDTEMEEETNPEVRVFVHPRRLHLLHFHLMRIMKEEVKPEKRLSSDISVGAL